MTNKLREYEWQFIINLIARLDWCSTTDEFFATLYEQLRTMIPYYKGVAFLTARKESQGVLYSSYSTNSPDGITDHSFFTEGDYPAWSEFIMESESTVFRQSYIIDPQKWEQTRVYREVWQPQNIYWGLMISVVANDVPLAMIGFFRSKEQEDFNERDMYILKALKRPVEAILYRLLQNPVRQTALPDEYKSLKVGEKYGLTKRETEIAMLVSKGTMDSDICEQLFIAQTTLNKHISNIYNKTGAHSRMELMVLFR